MIQIGKIKKQSKMSCSPVTVVIILGLVFRREVEYLSF